MWSKVFGFINDNNKLFYTQPNQICVKSSAEIVKPRADQKTHMRTSGDKGIHGCESCGKRFTQKGNLKTHVRSVHTGEKPFECGICGKSFSQKGNMQTHIRTHNKDDKFPCGLCGKTYSQKGNLKAHMQRHTSGSGTASPKRRQGGGQSTNSTDEDSVTPMDHSIPGTHRSDSDQHLAEYQSHNSTPEEDLSPQNLQLKYAHQSSTSRDPLSALVSLQNSALHSQSQSLHPQHRNPGHSSPITSDNMPFSSCSASSAVGRMLYSSPTSMPSALSAHQSWLAAAGASQNLSGGPNAHKSRNSSNPYEAFSGLSNPYSNFAAVQASLSLLSGVGASVGANEHLSHHHKQQHSGDSGNTSSVNPSVGHTSSSQLQFQTSNPNPDFSQLQFNPFITNPFISNTRL